MPLNGSDVASAPSGTTAVSGSTIESASYNALVADIYQILNTVRTIAKGFTGASTAQGAVDNFFTAGTTVRDDALLLVDPADTTKKVRLDAGSITAGATRVLTAPDASTTLVGTDTTQTLSNKTLTTPQINDTSSNHQYVFAVSELTADRTVTLPLLTANDEFVFKAHNVQAQSTWTTGTGTTESLVSPAKAKAAIDTHAAALPGAAKAWVSFDGTGTVTILDSFGVSSITDQGVGLYRVNLTNEMASANYAVIASGGVIGGGSVRIVSVNAKTTTYFDLTVTSTSSASDADWVDVAVFGDLA